MENYLKKLKKEYPNLGDLGKKVRSLYTHLKINGKEYYLNKDIPNDIDLGIILQENF